MRYILFGGRGILGSGFTAHLAHRNADLVQIRPQWAAASAAATIRHEVTRVLRDGKPTTIVWAAGVGHVGAASTLLEGESVGVASLCDSLRDLPEKVAGTTSVIFASSAGALFAGTGSVLIDEDTPPAPTSAYGYEKIRQEQLLRQLACDTGSQVVACRISNVYGLSQGHLTPRGLVSTAVRCTRLRQPMTLYVSPDTRRDYLFNRDAAALALECAHRAPRGFSTALVREGRSRTISEILGLVGAVARRRVPAVYAEGRQTRLQPRVLRFAPIQPRAGQVHLTPMETGIALMVRAPLATAI